MENDDRHVHVEAAIQGSVDLVSFPTKVSSGMVNSHNDKVQHALYLFESLRKAVDPTSPVLSSTPRKSSPSVLSFANLNVSKSIDIDDRIKKMTSPREAADLTAKELKSRLLTAEATMRILYRQNQELRDRLANVMGKVGNTANFSTQHLPIRSENEAATLATSGTKSSVSYLSISNQGPCAKDKKRDALSSQLGDHTDAVPGQLLGSAMVRRGQEGAMQLTPFFNLPRTTVVSSPSTTQGFTPSLIRDPTGELVHAEVRRQFTALGKQLVEQQIQHDVELSHMNEQLYLMERKREIRYIGR
ncbi:unnamed protein product [Phytomonas sp. EM1]|nr:unnamed protein product [Phytomonas sp. EM1]|eukprot:CCW64480.1 unnamed protein product [Phytomonas sp. isolate EM1]